MVEPVGYPEQETRAVKAQPWKDLVGNGLEEPKDGKLLIACPKGCDWGTFISRLLLTLKLLR